MAHRYHRGIHETDAIALAKGMEFHEKHHVEEHTLHEFNKTVIRNSFRETAGQVLTYRPRWNQGIGSEKNIDTDPVITASFWIWRQIHLAEHKFNCKKSYIRSGKV